ncbi:MAG: serine/threonine protein kinase [Deltaproteobacteria bacterium]|nr:serine/threonine protein kinase [Deltaproteobacteria bacterium]
MPKLADIYASWPDAKSYQELAWEGSFNDYLEIVEKNPKIARSAFQRMYDMIMTYGFEEYTEYKKKIVHYKFFEDPVDKGKDALFGIDLPLMKLVNVLQAAARRYGPEKRIILLHGPVGGAKSTIVRLLKKGIEAYSRVPDGALYSFSWMKKGLNDTRNIFGSQDVIRCPMHEEPLNIIPKELRPQMLSAINAKLPEEEKIVISNELCPACRFIYRELLSLYKGDWKKVLEHVQVRRVVLSEKDRIGIGTFQPKDEKNQDSTELTGDINYRKIAEYGSDSDPRAFNFDGEFNIANRGVIEFIEVLKLDVAFLYDLLGASQEHVVKPKKFAHTYIDEVIIGHSVAADTPVPYLERGKFHFEPIQNMVDKNSADIKVLAVDIKTHKPCWTDIKSVFRHKFTGEMMRSVQKWGVIDTTPNHSIYDADYKTFYPIEMREMLALRDAELPFVQEKITLEVPGTEERNGYLYMSKLHKNDSSSQEIGFKKDYNIIEKEDLFSLLKVFAWYITEGHTRNSRRVDRDLSYTNGIVLSQKDPKILEDLSLAFSRIYTGSVKFQEMDVEKHGAHRLNVSSTLAYQLFSHYCGEHSENKKIPEFIVALPEEFREFFLKELICGDGSRYMHENIAAVATEDYKDNAFSYTTTSKILATQIGFLMSTLGKDFSVRFWDRTDEGKKEVYYIRYVNPERRQHRCKAELYSRPVIDEWVYDIECVEHHNFVAGLGNVVCHNTNEAEYRKLQNNEYMEALRDRTVKIDIPYITKLREEIKVYKKDYSVDKVKAKHMAPHTIEMAAMWAILTRLEDPKKANLTSMQKLKLYDGKTLPGFTEDNVKELRKEVVREGLDGISPRYIQDKISNSLVADVGGNCVNPFMVLNELEGGLKHHPHMRSEEQRKKYKEMLSLVKEEYDDIVKNEVQRAISADEDAISRLCGNYIDHVKAYTQREKVRNRYTGKDEEPDERLMRSIEEKIDIPESRKDDFRREIMNYIGALSLEGKRFDYRTNERLHKALELKLFEDQKDTIKLTSLVSNVVDKDTQEKIDVVKSRLIKNYGYCETCATDVLHYVASIFARGDIKERKNLG